MEELCTIRTDFLLRECALDHENLEKSINNIRYGYISWFRGRNNMNYCKLNDSFTDTFKIYYNPNKFKGDIRYNYDEFISKLFSILNVNPEDGFEALKKKTELLDSGSIFTLDKLKEMFPVIHDDFIQGNKLPRDSIFYYGAGIRYVLEKYLQCQKDLYSGFIDRRERLKKYIEGNNSKIIVSTLPGIDNDKFNLYVASLYIEGLLKNDVNREHYIELLGIFKEKFTARDKYITSDNGTRIDYDSIVKAFDAIKDNRKMYVVPWVIAESTTEEVEEKKEETGATTCSRVTSVLQRDKLRTINDDRKRFYDSTGYVYSVTGTNNMHGYRGYVYQNGNVIVDKIATNSNLSEVNKNAIFVLTYANFLELSSLDKCELKKHVPRILHSGKWESRVKKYIDEKPTEESIEGIEKLKQKILELRR